MWVFKKKVGLYSQKDQIWIEFNMANDLSDKQIEEFKEAFTIFDKDQSGVISVEAVPILLRVIGQSLSNEEISVLAEQVR